MTKEMIRLLNQLADLADEAIKTNNFDYLINEHGFCTSSGYGDGSYDVYAYRCKEGIYCLEIVF